MNFAIFVVIIEMIVVVIEERIFVVLKYADQEEFVV